MFPTCARDLGFLVLMLAVAQDRPRAAMQEQFSLLIYSELRTQEVLISRTHYGDPLRSLPMLLP